MNASFDYRLMPGSMKTTLVFPIRDTPTDMTLRLKCKYLTPILAVVFVLLGNVVTQERCGGWKNFTFMRHKFLYVTVKEWLKSVLNYRSYPKFLDHPVVPYSGHLSTD